MKSGLGFGIFLAISNCFAVTLPPVLPAEIVGKWRLSQVTCNEEESSVAPKAQIENGDVVSTLVIPTKGDGARDWKTPANCQQKTVMATMAALNQFLVFTDGKNECLPAHCAESCESSGATHSFPYLISGNTLTLMVADPETHPGLCVGQASPLKLIYSKVVGEED